MKHARSWSIVVAVLLVGFSLTPVVAISPTAVMVYGEKELAGFIAVWSLGAQDLTTLKGLGFPGL